MINFVNFLKKRETPLNDLESIEISLGVKLPKEMTEIFNNYDVYEKDLDFDLFITDRYYKVFKTVSVGFIVEHNGENKDFSFFFDLTSIKIMALEDEIFIENKLFGFAETATNHYWAVGYGEDNYGKIFYVDSAIYPEFAFNCFNDFIANIKPALSKRDLIDVTQ